MTAAARLRAIIDDAKLRGIPETLPHRVARRAHELGYNECRDSAQVARHALAEALLGIEATTVEEYRNRAHALAMNWKLEE